MAGWVINQAGSFIAPDTAPVWAEAIFNLLLPRKDRDFVLGDLREGFQVQAKRYGKAYAQLDYIIGGILAIVDSRTIGLVRRLFKKD